MPTRSDTRYAVAMAVSALIAGAAFGYALRISPRLAVPLASETSALTATEAPLPTAPPPIVVTRESVAPGSTPRPTAPPPPVQPAFNSPPQVVIGTPTGSTFVDVSGSSVSGSASDSDGIRGVVTLWRNSGGAEQTIPAELVCNSTRTSCSWSASPPAILGTWQVVAQATDAGGRVGTSAAITVTVVTLNPGSSSQSDGGLINNLVGTVGGLVGGLL